jgi:hypothetical protein
MRLPPSDVCARANNESLQLRGSCLQRLHTPHIQLCKPVGCIVLAFDTAAPFMMKSTASAAQQRLLTAFTAGIISHPGMHTSSAAPVL